MEIDRRTNFNVRFRHFSLLQEEPPPLPTSPPPTPADETAEKEETPTISEVRNVYRTCNFHLVRSGLVDRGLQREITNHRWIV